MTAWLSGAALLLGHDPYEYVGTPQASEYAAEVAVLDTETSQIRMVPPVFPVTREAGQLGGTDADLFVPAVFLSPQLDLAAVSRLVEATIVPPRNSAVVYEVWDRDTHELVWRAKAEILYARRPLWVLGGDYLAIAYTPYEGIPETPIVQCDTKLWLVGRGGTADSIADCAVGKYSVSPDGMHIAAWIDASMECPDCPYLPAKLSLLDLRSGTADLFLLKDSDHMIAWDQYPIWSPDQRYVAFSGSDDTGHPSALIILDLATTDTITYPSEAQVVGWLAQ